MKLPLFSRNRAFFALQLLVALPWAVWWWLHVPAPGFAIGALGFWAVVMTVQGEMKPYHRITWMSVIIVLLFVEFSAIKNDRKESDAQRAAILREERENSRQILRLEQNNFEQAFGQQQRHFESTISTLVGIQSAEHRHFRSVVAKQEELFSHEEQLFASLNGKLVPASDPMPKTACSNHLDANDLLMMVGDNAVVTSQFPHTFLEIRGRSAVAIDKTLDGNIAVIMDIRSADGKIIARLNKDGFVVNGNNKLQMRRPDKSSLIIEDEYGTEVLNVRFLNPHAVALTGIVTYDGTRYPLQIPFAHNSCFEHGGIDLKIQ